jgi:hypothetical protein
MNLSTLHSTILGMHHTAVQYCNKIATTWNCSVSFFLLACQQYTIILINNTSIREKKQLVQDLSHFLLKPLHCFISCYSMWSSHASPLAFPVFYIVARSPQNNVEIHPIDSNARVILDAKVYMLCYSKTKIACLRECISPKFIFSNLKAACQ